MLEQTEILDSLKTFLSAYPSSSRIWIYQSSRLLGEEEGAKIEQEARDFTSDWNSHSKTLDATARLVFHRFLILIVNPGQQDASGCSIDTSVKFIQELEQRYRVNFLERNSIAILHDGNISVMPVNQLKQSVQDKALPSEACLFDNTITTLGQLRTQWLVPVYDSWLAK